MGSLQMRKSLKMFQSAPYALNCVHLGPRLVTIGLHHWALCPPHSNLASLGTQYGCSWQKATWKVWAMFSCIQAPT